MAALPLLSAGMSLASGAVGAMGAMYSANAQAAGLKSQAAWQNRQAVVEQTKTAYDINQQRRRTEATLGAMQVGFAAGGIDTAGGAPIEVGQSIVQESEMTVQGRRFAGQEEVDRLRFEAKNATNQAKAAKQAGVFNAVSSVIGGIGGAINAMPGTSLSSAFNVSATSPVAQPAIVTMPPAPVAKPKLSLGTTRF
jgi:hypothetical protein